MRLTPPKHSTFYFAVALGGAALVALLMQLFFIASILSLLGLLDLVAGCYFRNY
jgi:hypothetical protein